jgi:transposase
VRRVLDRAGEAGVNWVKAQGMPDKDLACALYPSAVAKGAYKMPNYEAIHREMAKPGVTLQLVWMEYCEQCRASGDLPYQLSQFKKLYRDYAIQTKATMHIAHKPGEIMEVDWAGQRATVVDNETGECLEAYLFVAVLPYSGYAYAEAFFSMAQESWIAGHVNAYRYFGGVTRILVPDNLKTAVTKHTKDEIIINSAYQDLESFYEVVVLPPPPSKPKGKPAVEKHVQYLETHLLEDLKEKTYFSIGDVNSDVKGKIAEINNRKLQGQAHSRKEAFIRYDKPRMRPLAGGSFSPCEYRYFARVPNNYHLLFDDHYYSTLYTHYGQPAILKAI